MAVMLARLTFVLALLPVLSYAEEIYRYTNEQGQLVLDHQGVPPQFIGQGYQVLNEQGRVIRVVPSAPSAAERQQLAEEKARASSDEMLLQLYASQQDIDQALTRKLAEIDSMISVVNGNQLTLSNQQNKLKDQAAGLDRSGREVPAKLLQQLEEMKLEELRLDGEVARFKEVRTQTQASYAADRARLGEILNR